MCRPIINSPNNLDGPDEPFDARKELGLEPLGELVPNGPEPPDLDLIRAWVDHKVDENYSTAVTYNIEHYKDWNDALHKILLQRAQDRMAKEGDLLVEGDA